MPNETNYSQYGCFKDDINQRALPNAPTSGTGIGNRFFTIQECQALAVQNNATVFGLQNQYQDSPIEKAQCFYSNGTLTPSEQIQKATQHGQVSDETTMCAKGMGKTMTTALYVNNNAMSFFNDLKIVDTTSNSVQYYQQKLNSLNTRFDIAFNSLKTSSGNQINPYGDNDITTIVQNSSGLGEIVNDYSKLKLNLKEKTDILTNNINVMNNEIKSIEQNKRLAEIKLYSVENSDNAAAGELSDVYSRSKYLIGENIVLGLGGIGLIMLLFKLRD